MKLFVPGRICIFGEHSDWAGGYRRINIDIEKGHTLIIGTNQGIYAEVEEHPTSLILTSTTPEGEKLGPTEIPMQPDNLLQVAQEGGYWSYIAGVAYQVLTNYHVRGLVIDNYKTDLPIKKGLSSSAAICVRCHPRPATSAVYRHQKQTSVTHFVGHYPHLLPMPVCYKPVRTAASPIMYQAQTLLVMT